ncbi:hypothetical protein GALMADRAFT_144144 [Galerina marginata CBS 339.88]|uniref:DUF4110 domain-containing protein n=1 Tax=Galerina marginata (strain CBS 339.88) TaxID=685588 RepID=A0A067SWD2_GALM3|nr:hypothetical protein GALMADRAFT_144144 [Galerina marginata CBS 339.88]
MAKKAGSAAAKAAKKAKAVQKVERKETKKAVKSKTTPSNTNATKSKGKSKAKKANDSDTDDDDLEGILERMQKEWEVAHTVTEELVEGPPSRRANATLTACPNGNHLWCIGGEFFSEDGRAYFYNDVFRYTPEKDEWRKFVSPTCPGPRSAHAVVASPAGGGKLFLFGGEFSSLHQNSFHHYRDFWCFDIATHSWDRIDTKIRPSARSGHRMAVWKHLIILFGGFYDPGITTRYLNDLWVFDTQEYKWTQVEFRETESKPSPRSGFSFLPCADGIVLHGGYCKEYLKGKRPVGVMLEDTWLLKITLPSEAPPPTPTTPSSKSVPVASKSKASSSKTGSTLFKWEKRKRPSDAYAPCLRSGCTMALWAAKSVGVLFGGVTDEDTSEEGLESVFWNDLFGYQLIGKGRWIGMTLKKPKTKGAKRGGKKKQQKEKENAEDWPRDGKGSDDEDDDENVEQARVISPSNPNLEKLRNVVPPTSVPSDSVDLDDPLLTTPLPRYNAMLAVLRNTLYIYGGIYERGSREYTLDDFYSLQLDKLDKYLCLKKSDVVIPDGEVESSSDEDDDDEDEDDEGTDDEDADDEDEDGETLVDAEEVGVLKDGDEEDEKVVIPTVILEEEPELVVDVELVEESELRAKATAFMGVAKDTTRSTDDVQSTPLPGETLAMFYARSREYWAQKALGNSDNKGKQLRRDGFTLAEERYAAYKPILEEVEKILQEAGLDEEEMRRGAAGGPAPAGGVGASRNRR